MLTSLMVAFNPLFYLGRSILAELQRALYIYPIGGILFWLVCGQIHRKRDKLRAQ